jgi:hypothetical protein
MRSPQPSPLPLVTLILLAAAQPGVARASGSAEIHVPATVVAGQVVELSWDGLPVGCEEAEVVLSLDGGRTFHVRVTPELEGRTDSFRWRVPDLPTEQAQLLLRIGGEAGERVGAFSRSFRILHAPDPGAESPCFQEGDAWTGMARSGRVGMILDPGAPGFVETLEGAPGEAPAPGFAVPRQPPARALPPGDPPPAPPSGPPGASAPARVPLRI